MRMSQDGQKRPQSLSSEDIRPSKQPRIFRACDNCVSAKTRCEEVTPSGCRLCRRKGRICSLSGTVAPDWTRRGYDEVEVDELRRHVEATEKRCAHMEKRYAVLEEQLHRLHTHLSTLSIPPIPSTVVHSIDTPTYASNPILDSFPASWRLQFGEALFGVSHPSTSYPDVTARRLLSDEEVDMAFQTFKNRFTKILPLRPFLLASTPVPSHPFIILAVLHHVQSMYHPDFANMVDESLLLAMSGVNNIDVILALLILALAPEPPVVSPRTRPSALRLIAMAYQLGIGLGLDAISIAALRTPQNLVEPFSISQFDLVHLWAAVINRYNILHVMHGRPSRLLQSIALDLPESSIDAASPSTNHLRAEAELVEAVRPVIELLSDLESGAHPAAVEDAAALVEQFRGLKEALTPFRTSDNRSILLDSLCIEFSHGFRLSCYIQNTPSPLLPIREALMPCTSAFPPVMRALVDLASNDPFLDQGALPSYTATSMALAVAALRRTVVFVHKQYPEARGFADMDKLRAAESYLCQLGGVPARLLEYADKVIERLPDSPNELDMQTGEVGLVPQSLLDMDFMSWDLSMLTGYYEGTSAMPP
ncbi:hypothetical protein BCR39DRAFT_546624 [Naematelia encephala]|uniref:Zn(2)-C6 fungal-type domain-containing protein n=1 Tax=Naematelia encephala TaxID=71784 RepID=A0A1Y2APD3_9TREE|nr:hypothetical protein BCR39DRAFT_546624 [Naematelia encephala]